MQTKDANTFVQQLSTIDYVYTHTIRTQDTSPHTCTYMHKKLDTHTQLHMHTPAHTIICTYIRTYAYTHTPTHIEVTNSCFQRMMQF